MASKVINKLGAHFLVKISGKKSLLYTIGPYKSLQR